MEDMTRDELLAFETAHPGRDAHKENAIRAAGLHPSRYYQQLRAAVRDPETVAKWPQTCARVQRLNVRRQQSREETANLRRGETVSPLRGITRFRKNGVA